MKWCVCAREDRRRIMRESGPSEALPGCRCELAVQSSLRGRGSVPLAHYSCAPASYRHGRDQDGACTRLLLCGPEAELPGSLPHSLSRYSHSGGSSTISRSYHQPQTTPKNLKVFGFWPGPGRRRGASQTKEMIYETRRSRILPERPVGDSPEKLRS